MLPISPLRQATAVPWEAPVQPDDEHARKLVLDELGKAPYQQAKPTLMDELRDEFLAWLGDLLAGAARADGQVGITAIIVGAAVLAGIAIWLARPRLNPSARTASNRVFDSAPLLSAAHHRERAAAAAQLTDWTTAFTEAFRALVRASEERLVLEPTPGRTADEATSQLRSAFPGQDRSLVELGRRFDEVLYGGVPALSADYAVAMDVDRQLLGTVPAAVARRSDRWTVPA